MYVVCLSLLSEFAGLIHGYGTFFRQLSVSGERINTVYWLTPEVKSLPRKSVVTVGIIDSPDMISAVYCGLKATNETKPCVNSEGLTYFVSVISWFSLSNHGCCYVHHNLFITLLFGSKQISVSTIQSVLYKSKMYMGQDLTKGTLWQKIKK